MYFTHPQFKNFSFKSLLGDFSEINLRNKLAKIFPNYYILFTDSGRSAFQVAVKKLNLQNSEMLIPAYICDIFKPILAHFNIKPIYLDIDLKTFHADLSNIESRITANTKSILICHTYGLPVELDKILEIAKKYNLKIIEDCAHFFPEKIDSDCAFLSFAKLMPVIDGGMLICKNPVEIILPKYKSKISNLIKFFRLFPIFANLSEKFRSSESILPSNKFSLPRKASKNSLRILDWYLGACKEQVSRRKELAKYFQEKLIEIGFDVQEPENNVFTYLSALVPQNINRDELFNKLRKKGIFCSRIWQNPLFPDLPNTQEAAKRIINFPLQNWFTEKDINKIISCILSSIG